MAIVALATLPNVAEVRLRLEPDRQIGLRIALDAEIVASRAPRAPRRYITSSTTAPANASTGAVDDAIAAMARQMVELVATNVLELQATARRQAVTDAPCECGAQTWSTTEAVDREIAGAARPPTLSCMSCGRAWYRVAGGWVFDTGTEPQAKVGRPPGRKHGTGDDDDDNPCKGHPAGPHDPMGSTVYCDGSCARGRR